MPTISFPVGPPPASTARPSQDTEMQKAVAKPQARESRTAQNPVLVQPTEQAEPLELTGREAKARLQIDFDKGAARYVYRLIDPASREVLREIPSEQALRLIRSLRAPAGLKVDQQT